MFLLVGLGNPGHEYAHTRHNAGFRAIEQISLHIKIPLRNMKHQALLGLGVFEGQGVILAKPLTFMNRSGQAVSVIAGMSNISASNILVIHDDLDLPTGKIRFKSKGGSGGHNGIKSIISHLGTQEFNRLKIGINRPQAEEGHSPVVGHVLERFSRAEEEIMQETMERATEAVLYFLKYGMEDAMNRFN